MYIRRIKVENYGPINNIDYSFSFDENNNPLPTVLIGRNGTGKTLFLIEILHSIIEIKRKFYRELKDVSGNLYYRMGSQRYIKIGENASYLRIELDDSSYVELVVNDYNRFKDVFSNERYKDVTIDNEQLVKEGFYNNIIFPKDNPFKNSVYLYFPVDRYYLPSWINSDNDRLSFITDNETIVGRDKQGIVQYDLLSNLESWIMDVIIDQLLYESQLNIVNDNGKLFPRQSFHGTNWKIHEGINKILTTIYSEDGFKKVRVGISQKENRTIEVIGCLDDGREKTIAPRFSNLSSGEIMILGIFSSIIKAYDQINVDKPDSYEEVNGVVIIDEIDSHLHSDQLRKGLPKLISLFPHIQFIVSSHSPFFLLGMKECFDERCKFLAMPAGINLDNIDNFEEIEKCYSIIDENYAKTLHNYQDTVNTLKEKMKPLIVTEGKTDWKHLQHALIKLKEKGQFCDLDISFLRYEYDFSDSKLESLLNQVKLIHNPYPIIGVFDSDSTIGEKYINTLDFGNNVYGCSITDTQGYECGISIELLYTRSDLAKKDEEGRRIFLTDEFTDKSWQLKNDNTIVCHNKTIINAQKRHLIKVVDSDVYDSDQNSLALSKNEFACCVMNEVGAFASVSVDGFVDIFNKISQIINKSVINEDER